MSVNSKYREEEGKMNTRKAIIIALILMLAMSLAACGGAGNLKGFLAKAEGNWYFHGDSRAEMLSIHADGSYEKYAALEDDEEFGTQNLIESGTISYDKDNKAITFEYDDGDGTRLYNCDMIGDSKLGTFDGNYYPADVSGPLRETFVGRFYADGDTSKDHFSFDDGDWKFIHDDENGVSDQSHGGVVEYIGGDNKELLMVEDTVDNIVFARLEIVSETKLKDKDSGVIYLLTERKDPDEEIDENEYDGGESFGIPKSISLNEHYYLDGDSASISLYFYDDGTVYIEAPEEGETEGIYSIDGDVVIVTVDDNDDIFPLTIEDDGDTLVDADGERYLLFDDYGE
jgi:hypothetical protein